MFDKCNPVMMLKIRMAAEGLCLCPQMTIVKGSSFFDAMSLDAHATSNLVVHAINT